MTDTQKTIWNFYKKKGLSDEAVAGIMGNIEAESGYNTSAINSSSGAVGLFQWLGSRKDGLYEYAESRGESVTDLNTQLEYSWKELTSSEKNTLAALKSDDYSSASEFAAAFEKLFERSGGSNVEKRQQYAENIMHNRSFYDKTVNAAQNASEAYNDIAVPEDVSLKSTLSTPLKLIIIILLAVFAVIFIINSINAEGVLKKAGNAALDKVSGGDEK